MKLLSTTKAEEFIAQVLHANQVPLMDAKLVAQLMVKSDLVGADGHGIFRLSVSRVRLL
jgi:LDH2 family malate/lactate/ureidoglycolate dehydrogenase